MSAPTGPAASFLVPRLDDTQSRLLYKIAAYLAVGLGLAGVVTASGTTEGRFAIFHALSASVVNVTYRDGTTQSAVSLAAGDRIYGDITSLTLVSGSGELYKLLA